MIGEIRENAITPDQSPADLGQDAAARPSLDNRICAAPGCNNILMRRRGKRIETRERWVARRYCCYGCSAANQAARIAARSAMDAAAPDWPETNGPGLSDTPFAEHNVSAGVTR